MVGPDASQQRLLLEAWLSAHQAYAALMATGRTPFSRRAVLARVASLAGQQGDAEYVYVLMERRLDEDVPAYVGKAKDPLRRWSQHLSGLEQGEGSYARWRRRLLREGHHEARFDLHLYVVGQSHVAFAPLPDFPSTIGSVEYQLIGLAAGAFPLPLLNVEGQAR
ncbi:GIY-YIG nuclease family protein [Deinococcus hopiensis]|uniref:GIY-YIG nuclease family protein n=1 Tax=Deinococcus hopiensis TaxID=309885 RepID=UPI0009FDBF84|nr:GIY-YIG nuclease family protein [Deinococcus hopiensis]